MSNTKITHHRNKNNILEKLTKENPCPQAFDDRGSNGYPVSELGYFRCDHDGYRWWNTVWPLSSNLNDAVLIAEFDQFKENVLNAFPGLNEMASFCRANAVPGSGSDSEFNMYAELEHGYYWLRFITRKGDYNLYIHCLSKAYLSEHCA